MTMWNSFNNYFAKGAIDTHPILHQILQFKRKYFDYIPLANNESLFVTPIDNSEVFNITSFKVESDGPNNFSIKILKLLNKEIPDQLEILSNQSFSSGIFSPLLKTSKITPTYKKGLSDSKGL